MVRYENAVGTALVVVVVSLETMIVNGPVWGSTEYGHEARRSYVEMLGFILTFAMDGFCITASYLMNRRWRWVPPLSPILVCLQQQRSITKAFLLSPPFADRDELLFGSSALFVHGVPEEYRRRHVHMGANDEDAEYVPIANPSAASLTMRGGSTAPRILFTIAEARGLPKAQEVIQQQISSLSASVYVRDLKLGSIDAVGTTAAGELRQLCGRTPIRLNLRQMTREAVGECLSSKLAKQGYKAVALHGAYGVMYRRSLWYPVLGFDDLVFRETLPFTNVQCYSFPGYCDRDLAGVVKQKLAEEEVFLNWLTLNSHVPYDRRDVVDYREALCRSAFGEGYNEQLCGYQNLHVQFFEHLSLLAEDETMRHFEVIVVGDHAPIFNDTASRMLFERERVPMLHLTLR